MRFKWLFNAREIETKVKSKCRSSGIGSFIISGTRVEGFVVILIKDGAY